MSKKKAAKPRAAARRPRQPHPLEKALLDYRETSSFDLTLYVTGNTPRSTQAIANIRSLCEKHLPGRHTLRVVDIYQQPGEARHQQIVAAPTLVKSHPAPVRRVIGDLDNIDRVLVALDLRDPRSGDAPSAATRWLEI